MRADGKIDHVEFPATDLAATRRFYGGVFGWSFRARGAAYAEFAADGPGGGFAADPAAAPAAPLVALYARHLGVMKARVLAAGGVITRDIHEVPGGRRFHFRDPAGNELAVWSEAGRPLTPTLTPASPAARALPRPSGSTKAVAADARAENDMDALWGAPRRVLPAVGK